MQTAPSHAFLRSSRGDVIAHMQPCNPAVGGPAKSQLVHEVDALGGIIGKMADRCYLQKRVLNRSKVSPPSATWKLPCFVCLPSHAAHLRSLHGVHTASAGAVRAVILEPSFVLCAAVRVPAWAVFKHHSTASGAPLQCLGHQS